MTSFSKRRQKTFELAYEVHCNDFFSKRKHLNYAKINKRGVLIRAGGWIKFLKINKRPPPCIRHLRVAVLSLILAWK